MVLPSGTAWFLWCPVRSGGIRLVRVFQEICTSLTNFFFQWTTRETLEIHISSAKNPREMHPFSYGLRVSGEWEMVSKCRVWEMASFHFSLVFYETVLSNITREAKHEEQRAVGKRAMKILVWNPTLSPGLLHSGPNLLDAVPQREDWEEQAACNDLLGSGEDTPRLISLWKGTCPAIDQNISVSAGSEPELSWYFQKDSCCFLWYEVRIN